MSVDDQEKHRQEKTLGRLQWLVERSKVGFKGNPPPFEQPKTLKSVEFSRKQAKSKFAGEQMFLPISRGKINLAEDSRTTRHLLGAECSPYTKKSSADNVNFYHQRIDKATGHPEIISALCWDLKDADKKPRELPTKNESLKETCPTGRRDAARRVGRVRNPYLASLSSAERTAMYRTEILHHPKFSKEGSEYLAHDAWYRGTQLEGALHIRSSKSNRATTRNPIRMRDTSR